MRTLTLVGAALLTVVLAAGPAHAETFRAHDAKGDVKQLDYSGCPTKPCPTEIPAPDVDPVDIVQLSANYRTPALTLAVRTRATATDKAPFLVLWLRPEHGEPYLFLVRVLADGSLKIKAGRGAADKHYVCPGGDPTASYAAGGWKVTIPASCLGDTPSIRVGAETVRLDKHGSRVSIDDALDSKPKVPKDLPTLSAPVQRG